MEVWSFRWRMKEAQSRTQEASARSIIHREQPPGAPEHTELDFLFVFVCFIIVLTAASSADGRKKKNTPTTKLTAKLAARKVVKVDV